MGNKFWKDWHLRTQICMIQFAISILTIGLIAISTYSFMFYISDFYMEASEHLFQKQYGQWTKIMMSHNIHRVQQTLFRSQQQIMKVNTLYEMTQQIMLSNLQQPTSCLNELKLMDDYAYSASFCYMIYKDTQSNKILQNLKDLSAFLTESVHIIDQDFDIMIASSNDIHFFTVWPGSFLSSDYNPQERIWYQQHLEQLALNNNNNNSTYYSEPHIHWTWKLLMIAQTKSLLNIDGSLDGVIASHVNFSQFNYSDDQVSFTIINPTGRILLSSKNVTEYSHIYDYNITNLGYQDYQQILNQAQGKPTQSNCDSTVWNDYGYLCRKTYNKQEEELISTKSIEETGLIFIMQSKLSKYQIEFKNMFNTFQSQLNNIFVGTILGFFFYMLSSLIITTCVVIFLFNPIIKIINYTSQQLFKNSLNKKNFLQKQNQFSFFQQLSTSQLLNDLQQSFNRLIHITTNQNKSTICYLIEGFKYPYKRWKQKRSNKRIRNINLKLKDNLQNEETHKLQMQIIKQLMISELKINGCI
ncbi:unnamed protein product [Paramecium primaurelia]|uniref:Uncharacterized protein n=1 Tax=Paramecium primaurelia TaxID=5886 RepID=A0A8S1M5J6_PARPR|nr:unnamed protein product [Paramecium primaurelia]